MKASSRPLAGLLGTPIEIGAGSREIATVIEELESALVQS